MKHFYTKALLLLVAILAYNGISNAQTYEQQIISFLKEIPKDNISNCNGSDIMNLLTDDSQKWVENIECQNINIIKGKAGVYAKLSNNTTTPAYIKIVFKQSNLMNAYRIVSYGNNILQDDINVKIFYNNIMYTQNKFGYERTAYTSQNIDALNEVLTNFNIPIYINGDPISPMKTLNSIEVNIEPQGKSVEIQLLGFRIYYSGTEDLTEVETAVEDLESELEIRVYEYYDLMGRKLAEAPRSGVFVRKCGGKVEKLIANGR